MDTTKKLLAGIVLVCATTPLVAQELKYTSFNTLAAAKAEAPAIPQAKPVNDKAAQKAAKKAEKAARKAADAKEAAAYEQWRKDNHCHYSNEYGDVCDSQAPNLTAEQEAALAKDAKDRGCVSDNEGTVCKIAPEPPYVSPEYNAWYMDHTTFDDNTVTTPTEPSQADLEYYRQKLAAAKNAPAKKKH